MIELSTDAYEAIVAHAREGSPEEVCGVLGGERGEPTRAQESTPVDEPTQGDDGHDDHRETVSRVESVHRATNVARSPGRTYLIDPEEQLTIMDDIEGRGRDVVGFYHSHPAGPTRPSPTDERRATWEGYSYAICLPDLPFVGSWRWHGERDGFVSEVVHLR